MTSQRTEADRPIRVAVGSTNPTKIRAVEEAVGSVWPQVQVIPVAVPSGVAEQPMGHDETIAGALNRARAALEATGADLGVGIEAGVVESEHGMLTTGWTVILDRQGQVGLGNSGAFLLPESIAQAIREGGELGPEMDRFTGQANVKRNQGAVGVFTSGRMTRSQALAVGVLFALTRFIHPEFYTNSHSRKAEP